MEQIKKVQVTEEISLVDNMYHEETLRYEFLVDIELDPYNNVHTVFKKVLLTTFDHFDKPHEAIIHVDEVPQTVVRNLIKKLTKEALDGKFVWERYSYY